MFCKKKSLFSYWFWNRCASLIIYFGWFKKGDKVIAPCACTATNIPFLYMGVKIKFADNPSLETMNISIQSVKKKLITKKTRAIICMHYGGLPCDLDELQKLASKFKFL